MSRPQARLSWDAAASVGRSLPKLAAATRADLLVVGSLVARQFSE